MAIQSRSEFASALNQVCSERGLEPEVVIDAIKQAILAAYRKDYGESENITVGLDANSGEVTLKKDKKVVTPPGFGRIAAQTAKQVILQRIRESEKEAIMSEYTSKVGTIVSGIVQRISGPIVTINLGKAEGIMPPGEQSRWENYYANQRLKLYVVGIKEGTHGEEIILSRAHNGLLEALFKQEVPEIAQGSVEIKAVAREAGSRSKVAVFSDQMGVDPVGSCVGQKGVRVQAVMNELGSEKIDIIAYQEDPAKFIEAALSPAKDLQVKIDEGVKTTVVTCPDDQLSLAIGKEGQNVRLAAKLTGYKIDIQGKSGTPREVEQKEKAAQDQAKKALGITDENLKPSERAKIKKGRENQEGQETKEEKASGQNGATEKLSAAADLSAGQSDSAAQLDQPAADQSTKLSPSQEPADEKPAVEPEKTKETQKPVDSLEKEEQTETKEEVMSQEELASPDAGQGGSKTEKADDKEHSSDKT